MSELHSAASRLASLLADFLEDGYRRPHSPESARCAGNAQGAPVGQAAGAAHAACTGAGRTPCRVRAPSGRWWS